MPKKLSPENMALLYRNLASAVRQELPFADLFAVLKEDPDLSFKKSPVVPLMHDAFKEGKTLADAMMTATQQFPATTVELVRQAEKSGHLANTLDNLGDEQAWLSQMSSANKGATAWPLTLLALLALLAVFYAIFVMPAFDELYANFGAQIPWPTLVIFVVTDLLATYWWAWLAIFIVLRVGITRNLLPHGLMLFKDRLVLTIPFVRNFSVRCFSYGLMRWLTLCAQNPAMRPFVLAHIKANTNRLIYHDLLNKLSSRLTEGQTLGQALDQLAPLPRRIALQIQIGEKSGNLEGAIAQALDAMEEGIAIAQQRYARGTFLASYILVGILIGFTVIALYLPIFSMGEVI
jgi:type IV pilus assembly protein PilC